MRTEDCIVGNEASRNSVKTEAISDHE